MKYYEKFGHVCTLKAHEDFQIHSNKRSKLRNAIIKCTSINQQSHIASEFFNSHSSVVNEMKFHLENHPMTIHPFSRLKFMWEIFMAVIFLIGLIYNPLQYMDYVDENIENTFGDISLMVVVKIASLMDMIMRFFMGSVRNYEVR